MYRNSGKLWKENFQGISFEIISMGYFIWDTDVDTLKLPVFMIVKKNTKNVEVDNNRQDESRGSGFYKRE